MLKDEPVMKKDLHPAYHPVELVMTDGSKHILRTTWGEPNARLQLVIDSKNHPAYTGERKMLDSVGRIEKFNRKYGQQEAPKA
jgi:large subunit ribosomal protein L31